MGNNENIEEEIKRLKNEIADLEERIPAHSPNMKILQKLEELKVKLKKLNFYV